MAPGAGSLGQAGRPMAARPIIGASVQPLVLIRSGIKERSRGKSIAAYHIPLNVGAKLWSVVGVVMAWILPGSVLVRGCAMLLPAVVLSSCGHIVKPVAEGRHS